MGAQISVFILRILAMVHNAKALAELLNVRHAEIRAFLHSQLPPGRAEELKQQLLGSGIPL